MILVSHVILFNYEIQEPIKVSYYSAKYGDLRHSGIGDIIILVLHDGAISTCLINLI